MSYFFFVKKRQFEKLSFSSYIGIFLRAYTVWWMLSHKRWTNENKHEIVSLFYIFYRLHLKIRDANSYHWNYILNAYVD